MSGQPTWWNIQTLCTDGTGQARLLKHEVLLADDRPGHIATVSGIDGCGAIRHLVLLGLAVLRRCMSDMCRSNWHVLLLDKQLVLLVPHLPSLDRLSDCVASYRPVFIWDFPCR